MQSLHGLLDLIEAGRRRLHREHPEWSQFAAAVGPVMEGLPEEQS